MHRDQILRELDELIQRRSILRHPFYLAWQAGELTDGQLATYAEVYYPHVAAFPQYLRNTIGCTSDEATCQELAGNLADELGNPAPHPELWLNFAELVGVNRAKLQNSPPSAKSITTVAAFANLTTRDSVGGLAALYAYESQQPLVAAEKLRGLRDRYGVTEEKGTRYFEVHATADVAHCAGERAALARAIDRGATGGVIAAAANQALDAYWQLLDGVCEQAGIACASQ